MLREVISMCRSIENKVNEYSFVFKLAMLRFLKLVMSRGFLQLR